MTDLCHPEAKLKDPIRAYLLINPPPAFLYQGGGLKEREDYRKKSPLRKGDLGGFDFKMDASFQSE